MLVLWVNKVIVLYPKKETIIINPISHKLIMNIQEIVSSFPGTLELS